MDWSKVLDEVFAHMAETQDRDTPDMALAFADREHDLTGTPSSSGEAKAALGVAFMAGMIATRRLHGVHRWWDLSDISH